VRKNSFTRGYGFLEDFLTKLRARKANSLTKELPRKDRILDIGCGCYPYFLINNSFSEKYGIDPSLSILEEDDSVKLMKMNIEKQKLPFKNDFFDAVTMLAVFEHINNDKLDPVLKEIKRVLKKGGLFVLTTPAPWADWLLHFTSKIGLISKDEIEDHKHNHSDKKISAILERSGFKKEKIRNGFFEMGLNMWFCIEK
jgi:ubiquinone/menaquinone biosynthesis C-methylase UbiE